MDVHEMKEKIYTRAIGPKELENLFRFDLFQENQLLWIFETPKRLSAWSSLMVTVPETFSFPVKNCVSTPLTVFVTYPLVTNPCLAHS